MTANTANITDAQPKPARKRGWLGKLLLGFAGVTILIVIAWFVVTSDAFFKGVIIPRIGRAMHATLAADAASLSPFSQVAIRGLKLQTTGSEPLLTAVEIRARYSLTAILGGNLKVHEVLIDAPVVTIVENADGTKNTDPLTTNAPAAGSKRSSAPPQVDLKQFNLRNATVRYIRHHPGGTRDIVEISGLNITLDDVKNGAAGRLSFALAARLELNPPDAAGRGTLQLKHDGQYTFTLAQDLIPTQIQGSDRTDVTQADGVLAGLVDAGVDMVADMSPSEIKGIALRFRKGGNPLGEVSLRGPFDSVKREGRLAIVATGVDQRLLNVLGAAAGVDFGSTSITFSNRIEVAEGGAVVRAAGRLAAANLQINRPGTPSPTFQLGAGYDLTLQAGPGRPLRLTGQLIPEDIVSVQGSRKLRIPPPRLALDASLSGARLELSRLLLTMPATARSTNELTVSGAVDMGEATALAGHLTIAAGSLDLTPYYDLFTANGAPAAAGAPGAEQEPEAVKLPFSRFVCDVNVRRIFLREVDVSELKAVATLDGGRIIVKPLQCLVNGAPVTASAEFNPGVRGFEYGVTLEAHHVPLAPLVDSFQPDRKGQVSGTASATAMFKGAGITGASLQKHLSGRFDLVSTNLNLSLSEVRTPVIKSLINVIVAIPDAIRNPAAAAGSVLVGLLGGKRTNGFVDELTRSPINALAVHGRAADGRIELTDAFVESPAFRGSSTGTIDLAAALTNSTLHFPVAVALGRPLADRLRITPAGTPTNVPFVALPDFVKMKGTLGAPKPDVNYMALAGLALQSAGGTTATNPASANPAPPISPAEGLIRDLGGLFGGRKKPPTNAPAPKPGP